MLRNSVQMTNLEISGVLRAFFDQEVCNKDHLGSAALLGDLRYFLMYTAVLEKSCLITKVHDF
ncbi:MAG: hypothetical protein OEY61_02415 [Gammaproteobacteria bacterium]|nr:hypothetical protein [Gammaproteobacteria bacterium]